MNKTPDSQNNYALKYFIVKQKYSKRKGDFIFTVFDLSVIGIIILGIILYEKLSSTPNFDPKIFFWIGALLLLSLLMLYANFIEKYRLRLIVGHLEFFPHEFHIVLDDVVTAYSYNQLHSVYYCLNMTKNGRGRYTIPLTYNILLSFKNGEQKIFHTEFFIRSSNVSRDRSKVPDIFYVFQRALPKGGVHESNKIIKKFLRSGCV